MSRSSACPLPPRPRPPTTSRRCAGKADCLAWLPQHTHSSIVSSYRMNTQNQPKIASQSHLNPSVMPCTTATTGSNKLNSSSNLPPITSHPGRDRLVQISPDPLDHRPPLHLFQPPLLALLRARPSPCTRTCTCRSRRSRSVPIHPLTSHRPVVPRPRRGIPLTRLLTYILPVLHILFHPKVVRLPSAPAPQRLCCQSAALPRC